MKRLVDSYCINLRSRNDRWSEFKNDIQPWERQFGEIRRIEAVSETDFPSLGCLKSHIFALTSYLCSTDAAPCVSVFEDDFQLTNGSENSVQSISSLITRNSPAWDVLMLTATYVDGVEFAAFPDVVKIYSAQSAAGYVVRRPYVHLLVSALSEGVAIAEMLPDKRRKERFEPLYNDQTWKRLQRMGNWIIPVSPLGKQRPSFSELEGKVVDYDEVTFGFTGTGDGLNDGDPPGVGASGDDLN